jgi:hypothetical protein
MQIRIRIPKSKPEEWGCALFFARLPRFAGNMFPQFRAVRKLQGFVFARPARFAEKNVSTIPRSEEATKMKVSDHLENLSKIDAELKAARKRPARK